MNKMIRVSKEEFFKVIYQLNLDVTLSTYSTKAFLKLRSTRELVGRIHHKADADEAFYEISKKWIAKTGDER